MKFIKEDWNIKNSMELKIRKYKKTDNAKIIDLLEKLPDYLIEIDTLKRLRRKSGYRKKYFQKIILDIEKNNGKIFVAEHNKIVGFIYGTIERMCSNKSGLY